MKASELLYPFYCFNCGNLAFVHRHLDKEQLSIVDYLSAEWRVHSCYKADRQSFENNSHIQKLQTLDRDSDRLPFSHRHLSSVPKQRTYSVGIVLSVPSDSNNDFYQVLTPENSVIEIKSTKKSTLKHCGVAVDLAESVRIGKGKYRVPALKTSVIPVYSGSGVVPDQDIYQVKLSSADPERLETFVDRFLKGLVSQNVAPVNVLPLKITRTNKKSTHHRQISIPSSSNFYDVVEKLDIPDFIELSAKQIKFPLE